MKAIANLEMACQFIISREESSFLLHLLLHQIHLPLRRWHLDTENNVVFNV